MESNGVPGSAVASERNAATSPATVLWYSATSSPKALRWTASVWPTSTLSFSPYPRLVDDHVRELRQAVLHVLHASGAHNPRPIVLVGPPEHGLIHPIGLSDQLLTEPERIEHLHRAAGDAIGLPELDRTRPALHDARRDPRELCQLSGQHQPGRTGAHDEDVDLGGQLGRKDSGNRITRPDSRVTDLEAIQVELHARATLLPSSGPLPCQPHRTAAAAFRGPTSRFDCGIVCTL